MRGRATSPLWGLRPGGISQSVGPGKYSISRGCIFNFNSGQSARSILARMGPHAFSIS